MDATAWAPLGKALLDYARGIRGATLWAHTDDAEPAGIPVRIFFRGRHELPELEQRALELCHGWILDAGAGAGCHALALQEQGRKVTALDVLPEAVRVMRSRGVRDARCGALADLTDQRFDTLRQIT